MYKPSIHSAQTVMQTSARAFERHQQIVEIVNRVHSIRVAELAEQLHVSESTIRTDLETLDEEGLLVRVRGGAIALESAEAAPPAPPSTHIAEKIRQHASEKKAIARWAAGLVENGDVIMLDASSTVFHIAQFLHDRRELTVFTNGISVAQALAKQSSNTVIVIGGILRPNGNAITGEISKQLLQDHHVRLALVSCSAFTPHLGFLETDLHEAQMKALMLQAAQQRVALLDASKIGGSGSRSFATLADFDYFVTDERIEPAMIRTIRQHNTHVIVCGTQTTRRYSPDLSGTSRARRRIGFANLSEHTAFSRDVRRGLEAAVQDRHDVELILADNQLNPQVALRVADELIAQGVDLVIEYQIDETAGNLIANQLQRAGIPAIAVDIPMVGATYFGVNNYEAGYMAGNALGEAIRERWGGNVDRIIVLEQRRAGSLPALRIQGQLDGLFEKVSAELRDCILTIDSDNTSEGTAEIMIGVLEQFNPTDRVALICFNDDAAMGVLMAARQMGCEQHILLVGQGADRHLRAEMRRSATPVVGATAYRPEAYGDYLLQLSLDILDGKPVAPAVYMHHDFITPANVDAFYPDEEHV